MINLIGLKFSPLTRKTIIIHTSFWILFIVYELAIVYYQIGSLERPLIYIVFYTINIALFYACLKVLNYTLKETRINYLGGLLAYLGLLVFFLIVKGFADYSLGNPQPSHHNPFIFIQKFFPRNIARGVYFTLLAIFYCSAKYIAQYKRQALEAEKRQLIIERQKAELETQLTKSVTPICNNRLTRTCSSTHLILFTTVHKNIPMMLLIAFGYFRRSCVSA